MNLGRRYAYSRDVRALCRVCHGDDHHWFGNNAQGVAVQHHDRTSHEVVVEVYMHITYGASAETAKPAEATKEGSSA